MVANTLVYGTRYDDLRSCKINRIKASKCFIFKVSSINSINSIEFRFKEISISESGCNLQLIVRLWGQCTYKWSK